MSMVEIFIKKSCSKNEHKITATKKLNRFYSIGFLLTFIVCLLSMPAAAQSSHKKRPNSMPRQIDEREVADLLSEISESLDPLLDMIMASTRNMNNATDLFNRFTKLV